MTQTAKVQYTKSVVMREHEYTSEMPPHRFQLYWKGKEIPLQDLTGPEDSRKLRLPEFKTIST
jgi:hypothetical protein